MGGLSSDSKRDYFLPQRAQRTPKFFMLFAAKTIHHQKRMQAAAEMDPPVSPNSILKPGV
jgi:hypothetical protein